MQYILEFTFFQHRVNVLFPVQFTIKNHTLVFICIYSLHCFSFNVDWFGAYLILPKISAHLFHSGNIQIQVIFITPIHKVSICLWYSASSSLLIFPTSSVLSANFTRGRDSIISASTVSCIQRKQKGC